MRYFCISDIHGNYDAMEYAIKESEYNPENPEHQLVSLGDEFGRSEKGLGSKGVYEYLTSDIFYNKPIVLKGNHQQIYLNILKRKALIYSDVYNGEHLTLSSLTGLDYKVFLDQTDGSPFENGVLLEVANWIKEHPFFLQTKNYYLFHGWCPDRSGAIERHPEKVSEKRWWSASWENTEDKIKVFRNIYPDGYKKTLVFGHWGTEYLRERFPDGKLTNDIWRDKKHKLVGLDQTTFYNDYIKLYDFEDDPE